MNGYIIRYVIDMAQALNDTRVHVTLDEDAVAACLEFLEERECPQWEESEEFEPEHCTELEIDEVDPATRG